jgi:hypothetical protein
MAMPRLPLIPGRSQDLAAGTVMSVGLANTSAPQVCIIERRKGFCW